MVEVPEHLLQRSRARREALGLATGGGPPAGGGGDAGAPPAAGAIAAAPSESAPVPATVGASAPAVAPAPSAPALPEAPAPARPAGPPPYISPATGKTKVPVWMLPVLAILPVWGFLYFGTFGDRTEEQLPPAVLGAQVYRSAGCSGCHGAAGEGNEGIAAPALAGGEVALTFPDEADHIAWIESGSIGGNQVYGDPNRPGGAHVSEGNLMPGFAGSLTPEEIEAVVLYEREEM